MKIMKRIENLIKVVFLFVVLSMCACTSVEQAEPILHINSADFDKEVLRHSLYYTFDAINNRKDRGYSFYPSSKEGGFFGNSEVRKNIESCIKDYKARMGKSASPLFDLYDVLRWGEYDLYRFYTKDHVVVYIYDNALQEFVCSYNPSYLMCFDVPSNNGCSLWEHVTGLRGKRFPVKEIFDYDEGTIIGEGSELLQTPEYKSRIEFCKKDFIARETEPSVFELQYVLRTKNYDVYSFTSEDSTGQSYVYYVYDRTKDKFIFVSYRPTF